MFETVKQIHFLGVGGIGVSALAEIFLKKGYVVSGSDLSENVNTQRLAKLGAKIFMGHDAVHLGGADLVVYSSAVSSDNPEFIEAKRRNLPLLKRGDCLAQLMENKKVIAITGSHGKTTTTSILAEIFLKTELDPTIASGGVLAVLNSPARFGKGDYFIAEGDESDGSFLYINPLFAIVTSMDADHLENYHDSFSELQNTFIQFLNKIPRQGCAVLFADDPHVTEILPKLQCAYVTYGFSEKADYRITQFEQGEWATKIAVTHKNSTYSLRFNLPGKHNALNALAAWIVANLAGVKQEIIQEALDYFHGVARRFQYHGQIKNIDVNLLEDYGHHPKEILETIKAVRELWPNKKIQMIFQPHRYTRTKALFNEFVAVLQQVDKLYLIDIYEASEKPNGMTTKILADAINKAGFLQAEYVADRASLAPKLNAELNANDVLVLQGAGDVGYMRKLFACH